MTTRSAQEIWEAALGELQLQVSTPNYRTWLGKTVGLKFTDNQFVVGVPSTFVAEYLDKNQRSLIEKALMSITHHDIDILFRVTDPNHPSPAGAVNSDATRASGQRGEGGFNPRYTFDYFVVGDCNHLAYAAARGVAEDSGHSYNPLFIYGGVGLGKTHLLHAIGHAARARHVRVLYVSAESFTNDFITAIRERRTGDFRDKYRTVDLLLIDDIRFICGKEQTEECFFHTFNELHNANRQIVITGNCSPKAMYLLQDRLRSRFEWGLVADIITPDTDTRLAILQAKAKGRGVRVPVDVLELISHRAQQNVRELEGSLNRVIAYAKLIGAEPTLEVAARALEDIASKQPEAAAISPQLVVEAVADSLHLTVADLKGRKKDREITLARHLSMYLIRQETNSSLSQTGKALGGKNPSTVSHACEKMTVDMDTSPYLRNILTDVRQKLSTGQKE